MYKHKKYMGYISIYIISFIIDYKKLKMNYIK
jgi:hypothetical protein